jgi:ribosomal protein L17
MARATITIVLTDTTDEKAVEIKRQIEKLIKDVQGAEVQLYVLPR